MHKSSENPDCEDLFGQRSTVPTKWSVAILSLAAGARVLAVREFLLIHPPNSFYYRPYEMGLVARSLVQGLGLSSPFGGATGPTAIVAPGYPALVAAVFSIFGTYTHTSAIVIMLSQILISLLTLWLMMHIAARTLDVRSAILAGAFWAVSLPLLWIPTIFWETALSQCALVAAVALALRCLRAPTLRTWTCLGACCGIAALINPALIFSLLAILAWTALRTRRTGCAGPLYSLLALAVLFAPWPIRNAMRFHAFIPLRSTVGIELYMGNHPGATGRLDESRFPMFNAQEMATYRAKGEVAYTHDQAAQAMAYIRAHPATFAQLTLRRIYRFWSGTGNLNGSPIYAFHALLTSILGWIGLAILFLRRHPLAHPMALPLLLFPLPYYITHAEFRYRLNIDPLLTIMAAYALTHIFTWLRVTYASRQDRRIPQR